MSSYFPKHLKDLDSLKEAIGEDITQAALLEDEATLVQESSVDHYELFGLTKTKSAIRTA
jgi:hypothetical protein